MKTRFSIIAIVVILGHFIGALVIKGFLGQESFWAIEVWSLFSIASACLGFYYILLRDKSLPERMTEQEGSLYLDFKDRLKEPLRGVKNITSAVEQVGILYMDTVNSIDRTSERLKRSSREALLSLNGSLERKIEDMKSAVEEFLSSSIKLKDNLKRLEEAIRGEGLVPDIEGGFHSEERASGLYPLVKRIDEGLRDAERATSQLEKMAGGVFSALKELHHMIKIMDGRLSDMQSAIEDMDLITEGQIDSLGVLEDIEKALIQLVTRLQRITSRAKLLSINAQVSAVQHSEEYESFMIVADEVLTISEEAGEVARQINKVLHDAFAKVESIRDNTKEIVSVKKKTSAVVEELTERIEEIKTLLSRTTGQAHETVNNTASLIEDVCRTGQHTGDMVKMMEETLMAIREDRQRLDRVYETIRKAMDRYSSDLSGITKAAENSYDAIGLLLQQIEHFQNTISEIKTEQTRRCNEIGATIEETIVAFQQMKAIDNHLRLLEKEAREVQRSLEELLQ